MIREGNEILKVNVDSIPSFLKDQPFWVNWKVDYKDGKGRKIPTYGNTNLWGQYWDTCGKSFEEVVKTIPAEGGLSFMLTKRNRIACIDIDNCTENDPRVVRILELAPDAWCEYSPSGNGIHIWGQLPDKEAFARPGYKTIGHGGKDYEWFATGRAMTVTGRHISGNSFPDLSRAISYCESLCPEEKKVEHKIIPVDFSVNELLEKAFQKDSELAYMFYHGHSEEDKSREDFRFCRKLWFWVGGRGAGAVEAVFRNSAMYREDKGSHYPTLTVQKAEQYWNGEYYGQRWAGKKQFEFRPIRGLTERQNKLAYAMERWAFENDKRDKNGNLLAVDRNSNNVCANFNLLVRKVKEQGFVFRTADRER